MGGILIVYFLDRPYANVGGSVKPIALTQVLERIEGVDADDSLRRRWPARILGSGT